MVVDGQLVAAVEEERFNRVKHWAGFPIQSIKYCLDFAGITPQQLDHVAVSFNPKANIFKRLAFVATHWPSTQAILDRLNRQKKTLGLEDQLAQGLGVERSSIRAQFHRLEHHQTHVAAGFLISPFDEAACCRSTVWATSPALSRLTHAVRIGMSSAASIIHTRSAFSTQPSPCTWAFPTMVMSTKSWAWLPMASPSSRTSSAALFRPKGDTFELDLSYFTHHKRGIKMAWNDGAPIIEPFYSQRLINELGPVRDKSEPMTGRHDNIAKSLQVVTEEIILHLLNVCICAPVAATFA